MATDEKDVFGLRGYDRQSLLLDVTDEVRNADCFYIKSEADKVIEDLIEKNKRLANKDIIMASEAIKEVYKELHHHKYKRCLDKAERCEITARFYGNAVPKVLNKDITDPDRQKVFRRLRHYQKWLKKWLELAEKFKEVK